MKFICIITVLMLSACSALNSGTSVDPFNPRDKIRVQDQIKLDFKKNEVCSYVENGKTFVKSC